MFRLNKRELQRRGWAIIVVGAVIVIGDFSFGQQDISMTSNDLSNRMDRLVVDEKEEAWWKERQDVILSHRPNGKRKGSSGHKKLPIQHQFIDFDPSTVLRYNISRGSSFVEVQVGRQGPAVKRAITHSFHQRRLGFPRKYFDTVAASKCLSDASLSDLSSRPTELSKLPQAILIGVQKGGTTALYAYLEQHPQVAQSTKELYFLDEQMDEMVIANGGKGIPQKEAQNLYQRIMSKNLKNVMVPSKNETMAAALSMHSTNNTDLTQEQMILDWTPHYIIESDRIPSRVACIVPWVKLFVLLRNPIDRARSQYDMKREPQRKKGNVSGNGMPTFDEYVRYDIDALKETGVIQDWNRIPFDDFWDTPAMWEAWRTYVHSGLNAPVGMGLYALQIKPFLDLPNDFLVIRSEDLQTDTDDTFQKVLEFLGLPHYQLPFYPPSNRAGHRETVSPTTQALLEEVFEPFNRKLGELLGDEWKDVWKS